MKKVVVLVVVGVAAFLVYRWAKPPLSPFAGLGFPPEFERYLEEIDKQVREDTAGDLGDGAVALCRARLGIKEKVERGEDLISRGYGEAKAEAFTECVLDLMYPAVRRPGSFSK